MTRSGSRAASRRPKARGRVEPGVYAAATAVAGATPLSENEYKVQLAKVAVKRAILLAAGLETGGF